MSNIDKSLLIKQLPSVEDLLLMPALKYYADLYSTERLYNSLETIIEEFKTEIKEGNIIRVLPEEIAYKAISHISKEFNISLKPVINASGIVIHPYLGRAPLAGETVAHITNNAIGYCNLDFNIEKGTGINRLMHLRNQLVQLTGAESAMVVNNNASALLLIGSTFARDKNIIISRGEIIEIGQEFRLPEIIKYAGSRLIEVGTTNSSYLKDYSQAIENDTALIMKVHTSSYYIKGHTNNVELFALVELAKNKGILSVADLGTGLLIDLCKYNLPYEPTVKQTLKTGVDLLTYSGDKLFGGPQAGIILGKRNLIDSMINNPLSRALWPDKLTISALEGTLQLYLNPEKAINDIPVLRMLTKSTRKLEFEANQIYEDLKCYHSIECGIKKGLAEAGGSILPEVKLPTYYVWIRHSKQDSCTLHKMFLNHNVLTLIKGDTVILDPRCLIDRDFRHLSMILEQIIV